MVSRILSTLQTTESEKYHSTVIYNFPHQRICRSTVSNISSRHFCFVYTRPYCTTLAYWRQLVLHCHLRPPVPPVVLGFYRAAAMHPRSCHERLSVCLSICQTHDLWQNETNFCPHSHTIWMIDASSFPTQRMVGGGRPLLPEILGQIDPPAWKMPNSNRYSLVAPQPWHLAKQVQLSLTGNPLRALQWA